MSSTRGEESVIRARCQCVTVSNDLAAVALSAPGVVRCGMVLLVLGTLKRVKLTKELRSQQPTSLAVKNSIAFERTLVETESGVVVGLFPCGRPFLVLGVASSCGIWQCHSLAFCTCADFFDRCYKSFDKYCFQLFVLFFFTVKFFFAGVILFHFLIFKKKSSKYVHRAFCCEFSFVTLVSYFKC